MPSVVADTHALVWYASDRSRLSAPAAQRMDEAVAAGLAVVVSAITLVELVYLAEKGRLPHEALVRLDGLLDDPHSPVAVAPVDRGVARVVERIARSQVPDMPDRIIAATALHLGLPLVSRDRRIQASGIDVVW